MVERVAKNVRRMFAPHLELGDLIQAGRVGLVAASNTYDPAKGNFEPYAYFRVRGAIIDSQKRRVYREERNVSLHAIAEARGGWLPPALDTDAKPLPDTDIAAEQIRRLLWRAIGNLPDIERQVMEFHLAGVSLTETARRTGLSLMGTRAKFAGARALVGAAVRGR